MRFSQFLRWFGASPTKVSKKTKLSLNKLEEKVVLNGYVAVGAGPGYLPLVAIRVDKQDAQGGSFPNNLGEDPAPRSDGRTEFTSQVLMPFSSAFRGGVHVSTGNFDGKFATPNSLVTAAGPGGGPHVIVWNMKQNDNGDMVTDGILDQFFAYDPRFRGGVNVTCGDLDGDGIGELITGAGPGGAPHVKVFKLVNGKFQLANEFMAYDPKLRSGVSVASNQGYQSLLEVRAVLDTTDALPDALTPYPAGQEVPGEALGFPLIGFDIPVPAGGVDPNTGFPVPGGHAGTLNDEDQPLPYISVGSGGIQLLGGNLINSLGNIAYRPVPLPEALGGLPGAGEIVFAEWDEENLPAAPDGAGIVPDTVFGPFIQLADFGDVQFITRLVAPPGNTFTRNQLVTAPGPGGASHVKVWDFQDNAGMFQNNGAALEFFAFDPSFMGGVNVAIGDVINNPLPAGKINTQPVNSTTHNTGSSELIANSWPFDTSTFRFFNAEIICSQASGGSQIRIFSDQNKLDTDPFSDFSNAAPVVRTSVAEVNLKVTTIDASFGLDPTSPLTGFISPSTSTNFNRAVSANFTGGVSVAMGNLLFNGGASSVIVGNTVDIGQGSSGGVPFNPVMAQTIVGAGTSANQGARVNIFNQMTPMIPGTTPQQGVLPGIDNDIPPWDSFLAFERSSGGLSVAFGFGELAEPGLSIISLNVPLLTAEELQNPILLPSSP